MEDTGNWTWKGMQICPEGQYVYGMRTKLSERDGLAGLILLCRNMKNSKEISERLIFDGDGSWGDSIVSGGFAIGYKAKYNDTYLTGISLAMAAVPYIFAFNFNYQFPKNFNTQHPTRSTTSSSTTLAQRRCVRKSNFQRKESFRGFGRMKKVICMEYLFPIWYRNPSAPL
jgi:hypothetical protein